VTRKITRAVAAIAQGRQVRLYLGNLDATRDWGHARDYARGMWLMLQQPEPDDFVLATGESHSVREFVERALAHIGRTVVWHGKGVDEVGVDAKSGEILVKIDPRYFRPTEVDALLGDARKAHQRLGWRPSIGFDEIVREMVDADLQRIEDARSFRHE
jgi:GDPmannose 4,6-dehydratase